MFILLTLYCPFNAGLWSISMIVHKIPIVSNSHVNQIYLAFFLFNLSCCFGRVFFNDNLVISKMSSRAFVLNSFFDMFPSAFNRLYLASNKELVSPMLSSIESPWTKTSSTTSDPIDHCFLWCLMIEQILHHLWHPHLHHRQCLFKTCYLIHVVYVYVLCKILLVWSICHILLRNVLLWSGLLWLWY